MSATAQATPVRYDPRYSVERVVGVGVFLLSEENSAVLSQPIHLALGAAIDGACSADDLAEALAGNFPAWETYHAVEELTAKGYLATPDESDASDAQRAYWGLAGVAAADAERELAAATVSATALGTVDAGVLQEALAAAGLAPAPGEAGTLAAVATDDYLDPALAAVDERHRAAERPWLLLKPVGATVWLGPLLVPGRTGCWHCLAQRLEGNRAVESYLAQQRGAPIESPVGRAHDPAAARFAAALAAQQLRNLAAAVATRPLEGTVITVDTRSLAVAEHALVRRPQCPACGDPELVARHGSAAPVLRRRRSASTRLHRAQSVEATLAEVGRHVSPITGAVKSVDRVFADDEGVMQAYTAGHNFAVHYDDLAFLRRSLRVRSGGKGRTEAEARVGAICEALERYSSVYRGDEPTVRGRYSELGDEALHPNDVMLFSGRQYRERERLNEDSRRYTFSSQLVPRPFDVDAEIEWTPLWSPRDGRRRLLPAGMCYFNYASYHGYRSAAELFYLADSNGLAAGSSLEDAALQGVLELIERDAVGMWWYNRLPRPAIDLATVDDPYVERLATRLDRLGRDVWAIDLTNDLGIPVVCAVSRRRGTDEELVFGFGAHLDPATAVVRSLTELTQFLASFEKWGVAGEHRYIAFDQAAASWWESARLEEQSYLAPAPGPARALGALPDASDPDLLTELTTCIDRIGAAGVPLYLLDQTRPDVGLPVVKAVAPGLRHMWSRLGPGRLYDVPVALGWLERPTAEEDLNPWAVFF
jgi:bacteriocin biosynthesis cyclodehydratase domain-containing protein